MGWLCILTFLFEIDKLVEIFEVSCPGDVMDVNRLVKKLELNENVVSTFLGGMVLIVVSILMINYFGSGRVTVDEGVDDSFDSGSMVSSEVDVTSDMDEGQISATAIETYETVAGDSLWKIAEKLYGDGYRWAEIAQANSLNSPNLIEVGQVLNVPAGTEIDQLIEMSPDVPDNYMVKRGDSLWKISERFYGDGFSWTKIWQQNESELPNPDLLIVGRLLELP